MNNVAFAPLHVTVLTAGIWAALSPRAGAPERVAAGPEAEAPSRSACVAASPREARARDPARARDGRTRAAAATSRPRGPSADRFLEEFVAEDGRVVRRDQGGDTVTEGQAYAMLVAAADGRRAALRPRLGLDAAQPPAPRRPALVAVEDGRVADEQPAADADLDIAAALIRAAERFERPELAREAPRLGERSSTTRRWRRRTGRSSSQARGRPANA